MTKNKKLVLLAIVGAFLAIAQIHGDEGYLKAGYFLTNQSWDNQTEKTQAFMNSTMDPHSVYYTELFQRFDLFKYFDLGGTVKVYMLKERAAFSWNAFYLDYVAFAGIRWENIEVEYRHTCTHPQNVFEGISDPVVTNQTNNDEVSIKFTWKTQ